MTLRNVLIGLLSVFVILLVVLVVRQLSTGRPKTTAEERETAVAQPLPPPSAEREPAEGAAPAGGERKQAVEAIAKKGDMPPEKAARAYALLLEGFAAKTNPWAAAAAEIEAARAKHAAAVRDLLYNPADEWKSKKVTVATGDSLERIRKSVAEAAGGRPVTVGMIRRANRLAKDIIHPGQVLRVPQETMKVIVDRGSYTLRLYFGDLLIGFYRIGLGQPDNPTPTGHFVVAEKQKNPTWFPKGEPPLPFGDPKNPLGTRWISLRQNGAPTGYGIHGTSDDKAVGAATTQGCVRLYNRDVEELFEVLPEGSAVEIR